MADLHLVTVTSHTPLIDSSPPVPQTVCSYKLSPTTITIKPDGQSTRRIAFEPGCQERRCTEDS